MWEGRGAARVNPVEKLHRRRRRRTRNKLRGNSIKKGGCQSGLSWLPHPLLCAKFQERLSPCSRVCVRGVGGGGGDYNDRLSAPHRRGRGVWGGFSRTSHPRFLSIAHLLTHARKPTSKHCDITEDINNAQNTHKYTGAGAHTHTPATSTLYLRNPPPPSICQGDPAGDEACRGGGSVWGIVF